MSDDRVAEYLRSRARVDVPPDIVRSVMSAVDAAPAARSRFALPILAPLVAAAAVITVMVGILFLGGPRGGLPGTVPDCETDPVGLLRHAIERLERAEGYRWTQEEQMWGFEPAFPVSVSDPHYGWSGYAAQGAYLAPDRMRLTVTASDAAPGMSGPLGFPELIHVEGRTYASTPDMTDPSGEPLGFDWQELPAQFEPNWLLQQYRLLDDVGEEQLRPAELSWELPGEGGCEIVLAPDTPEPSGAPDLPPIVIAARVDAEGRIVAGATEIIQVDRPEEERRNDVRHRFSVVYETPDAAKIQPPDGPIFTYPPTPSASAPPPS